ncbi:hypothetical protein FOA52_006014 [Chlamydomonas sp. UWO 241]|nr:hypothetical protein FOA52_006014 [Chlamydomonas sp. UWO 241]
MSVGTMSVRQMHAAVQETALRLLAAWKREDRRSGGTGGGSSAAAAAAGGAGGAGPSRTGAAAAAAAAGASASAGGAPPAPAPQPTPRPEVRVLTTDPSHSERAPSLALLEPGSSARPPRSLLHISLRAPRSGNIASVKLISMENRMNDYGDDHDHPNVDCQFVALQGVVAELPPGTRLLG